MVESTFTMISFTSFPVKLDSNDYGYTRHHAGIQDDDLMDLDVDDLLGTDGSRLTCPGELLTSSQAYMRCGLFNYARFFYASDKEVR